jgi:hypothetical protein
MITTRVFDIDGTEKDLAWLAATWDGCEVLPAHIPEGTTEYWRLAEIHCTTGNVVVAVSARRGNLPAVSQPIVMTYPNLTNPSTALPTLPTNPHNWAQRGDAKRTNSNGLYEYELGPTFGPFYHAWIMSSVPSDCLSKTGMMGGTDHHGPLHGIWVLTPVSAPDPDPIPTGDVVERLTRIETKLTKLSQHLGADQAAPMVSADALAVDFDTDEGTRFTATGQQHRVKRASNLRQEANINAPIYALVNKDALVNVIGEDGDWWHVEFVGFIAKTQVGPSIDPPAK